MGSKLCRSLDIPFETERTAEIVYNSLRVDKEPKRCGTKRQMRLESNVVHVLVPRDLRLAKRWLQEVKVLVLIWFFCRTWSATEARSLRVSLNSFMDLLLLVIQTVEQFGPPLPT